jgi:hypothetical protein
MNETKGTDDVPAFWKASFHFSRSVEVAELGRIRKALA